jgi:hypothetical protein
MIIPNLSSRARILPRLLLALLVGVPCSLAGSLSPNNQFTVEVLTPNTATTTLIETNAAWRYFKGASNPNSGWDTADAVFLDATWLTGQAGFGYADGDDATVLGDMQNGYSTLFLRTTFSYDQVLDPRRLKLRIDYDDGFIAYLDGKEFARVNAPGEPGQRPPYNSLATASHEASRGPGGHPVETWYFDPDFPALFPHSSEGGAPVAHILAIEGLNRSLADDDFSIIPSLYLDDLFTLVATNSVQLAGRIHWVGVNRVTVNGLPALLNLSTGTWSITLPLKPGMNRLVVQARDCDDKVLASRTKDVVSKTTSRLVGGTIAANTSWDAAQGIVEVTSPINVSAGATLTIGPGTTVLFRPGTALGTTSGSINVNGTASNQVFFLPSDGKTPWGGLAAREVNSSLALKFAEVVAGGIYLTNNAAALVEDSTVRDFSYDQAGLERYIAYAVGYCQFTARRSVFTRYYTIAFGGQTTLLIEDCAFESAEHDFFKPQDTVPGSIIRRCTFAHSSVAGTDGIDTGANAQLTLDSCLFLDIADKAISVEASTMTVKNCLVYGCGTGMAVKDDSEVMLNNNSFVSNSSFGIAVYLKNAGALFAHAYATNNILWGNSTNITLRNPDTGATSSSATIEIAFSDVGGATNYPGTGNIHADPKFMKSSAGDFRLAAGSPALGTGASNLNMGAFYLAGATQALAVIQQPLSQTAGLASNTTLRVTAMGSPPIFYQWRLNGADLPGATAATLTVSNMSALKEGTYLVVASNREGSFNSASALLLLDNPLRINYSRTAACGSNVRLSGPAGKDFILQTSSNLLTWTPLFTNTAPTGILEFKDTGVTNIPSRFYRAAYLP